MIEDCVLKLLRAVLERAVLDAQGQLFYVAGPQRKSTQAEACRWLHSDEAALIALQTGITANKYRQLLESLEKYA